MLPLRLIPRNLQAHKLRSLLTLLSLTVATFLLCFLRSVLVSLEAGVAQSASNRLMVQSAVSLFVDLPLSYQAKIDSVPGVASSTKLQWFGGYYRDRSNFFSQFAVDHDRLLENYPEIELVEGTPEGFTGRRTACLVGDSLAQQFEWKVGDTIPILSSIFPRADGGAWMFDVAGIYHSNSSNVDNRTIWFHFKFLEESLETGGAAGPPGVGVYAVRLDSADGALRVAQDVDELFLDSEQRVQTTTEAEFQRQFVGMLGNVPMFLSTIGAGVVFAIALAVLNTMLMAARERTRDIGIMKALGFTDGTAAGLFVVESVILCGLGGGLGIALGVLAESVVIQSLGAFFPGYRVDSGTILLCLGGSVVLGLLAAAVPAWQVGRLRPVEAFRMEV